MGKLHSRVFPGPLNYESIRQGDRKETENLGKRYQKLYKMLEHALIKGGPF